MSASCAAPRPASSSSCSSSPRWRAPCSPPRRGAAPPTSSATRSCSTTPSGSPRAPTCAPPASSSARWSKLDVERRTARALATIVVEQAELRRVSRRRLLRGQAAVADRRVLPGLRSGHAARARRRTRSRSSRPPARSRPTSCSTSCAARPASASGSSSPSSAIGLAARGDDVQTTLRRAVPALRETEKVLRILDANRQTLNQLTRDADTVLARRSPTTAATSRASCARRATRRRPRPAAPSALRSTVAQAAGLPARAAPDARRARHDRARCRPRRCATCAAPPPTSTEFLKRLGPFADSARPAVRGLGARVGDRHRRGHARRASTVKQLRSLGTASTEPMRNLRFVLEDINDRGRATEPNTLSPTGAGFTGLEALLQYFFVQSQAINIYDSKGFLLKLNILLNECAQYTNAQTAIDHTERTEHCKQWLGPTQPGVTTGAVARTTPTMPKARAHERGRRRPRPAAAPAPRATPRRAAAAPAAAAAVLQARPARPARPAAAAEHHRQAPVRRCSPRTGRARPARASATSSTTCWGHERPPRQPSVASNPAFVGAVTVLVIVAAVLLAYQANQGLPFVPAFELKVDTPNAARLVVGNEVREGGFRVGQVTKIEPVPDSNERRPADAQARHVRRARARRLDRAHPPALGARAEVRRARARHVARRAARGRDDRHARRTPSAPSSTTSSRSSTSPRARTSTATSTTSAPRWPAAARRSTARSTPRPSCSATSPPVMRTLSNPDNAARAPHRGDRRRHARPRAGGGPARARLHRDGRHVRGALARPGGAAATRSRARRARCRPASRRCPTRARSSTRLAGISDEVQGTARELRASLPAVNRALAAGTPVLRRTPQFTEDLEGSLRALRDLAKSPTTDITLAGLTDTMRTLNPTLRYVGPHVTVCNYFTYFWTNIADHISDEDATGTVQRVQVKLAPLEQENSLLSFGATRPANQDHVDPVQQALFGDARRVPRPALRRGGRRPTAAPTASPASAATSSAWRPASRPTATTSSTRARPARRARRSRAARGSPRARPSPPSRTASRRGWPREPRPRTERLRRRHRRDRLRDRRDVPRLHEGRPAHQQPLRGQGGVPRLERHQQGLAGADRRRRGRQGDGRRGDEPGRALVDADAGDPRQRPAALRGREREDPPADLPGGQLLRRARARHAARRRARRRRDDRRRAHGEPGPVRPGPRRR